VSSTRYETIGELARRTGLPEWRVRRAVDRLRPDAPRAGQYRLISPPLAREVEALLRAHQEVGSAT
jgi:hypothetical protein